MAQSTSVNDGSEIKREMTIKDFYENFKNELSESDFSDCEIADELISTNQVASMSETQDMKEDLANLEPSVQVPAISSLKIVTLKFPQRQQKHQQETKTQLFNFKCQRCQIVHVSTSQLTSNSFLKQHSKTQCDKQLDFIQRNLVRSRLDD